MKAETILERARNSISRYCADECKAYCCRKGYLILNKDNVDLVIKNSRKAVEENKLITKLDGDKYSLYIGDYNFPCPCLKDFKCLVYKDTRRPLACKEFPLFLKENKVMISMRCLAVKDGLFYPYLARLKKMGFSIIESHGFSDFDKGMLLDIID